ncbi:hypothetical protein SOP94_19585 [Peribacillus frigoritolerans]|uniref:hypothetical protein n=1 Tax=Peribacillus frigoritolerans TaxID=450367 RepID=UPI002B24E8C1|nr:hypothetical protein [Peribacillus frigoritolerans]MEB2630661.1 hypothetical protein [Peribacillus frigoritolerans]
MDIIIKFKDGLAVTQSWGKNFNYEGDLLQLIKIGKENNAPIKVEDNNGEQYEKTWNDVSSIELILL